MDLNRTTIGLKVPSIRFLPATPPIGLPQIRFELRNEEWNNNTILMIYGQTTTKQFRFSEFKKLHFITAIE